MKPAKIGVIGCGMISDHYFKAAKRFPVLDMALCADLDEKLAAEKGELYGVRAVSCDELFESSKAIEWIDVCKIPEEEA